MDCIRIEGGHRLDGTISISGAKNAALALMPACLLSDKPLTLTKAPQLADIASMVSLLGQHGASVDAAFDKSGAAPDSVQRTVSSSSGCICQ